MLPPPSSQVNREREKITHKENRILLVLSGFPRNTLCVVGDFKPSRLWNHQPQKTANTSTSSSWHPHISTTDCPSILDLGQKPTQHAIYEKQARVMGWVDRARERQRGGGDSEFYQALGVRQREPLRKEVIKAGMGERMLGTSAWRRRGRWRREVRELQEIQVQQTHLDSHTAFHHPLCIVFCVEFLFFFCLRFPFPPPIQATTQTHKRRRRYLLLLLLLRTTLWVLSKRKNKRRSFSEERNHHHHHRVKCK